MSRKPWFRFYIDAWFKGTTGLSPNEIAAYITVLCELYDNDGFVRLDVPLMARRCGMRPTSFQKALDELIERDKLTLEAGFITCRAVTKEIESREKLIERSGETRRNRAEKVNEIKENLVGDTPYIESRTRIKKTPFPFGAPHRETADERPLSPAMLDFIKRRELRRRGQS